MPRSLSQSNTRQRRIVNITGDPPFSRGFALDWWPLPVERALVTFRHVVHGGDDSPTAICRRFERLAYKNDPSDESASCCIPWALWPVVHTALLHARIRFHNDHVVIRLPALVEAPATHQSRSPPWLSTLLRRIQASREVIVIRHHDGPSVVQAIEWILRSFPAASVAVVCDQRRECVQIANRLLQVQPDTALLPGGVKDEDTIHQVVVGTWASGHPKHDFVRRDLIIFPNGRHAIGERGRAYLQTAGQSRLIGFVEEHDHHSQFERDWLTAIFGFGGVSLNGRRQARSSADDGTTELIRLIVEFIASRPGGCHE